MSTPSRPTVLLFDIDGTLLTARGSGKRAMNRALSEVLGYSKAFDGLDFRGMTDALIIEQALAQVHGTVTPSELQAIYAVYLEELEKELRENHTAQAMPGALKLLDWLSLREGKIAIGLGTGNIERAAYMKLRHVGLDAHFTFGGFGSDHRVRSEIIRIAAERGCKRLGCAASECLVVVIGDTVHDVDAALSIGARAIAVATSGVSPEVLLARGATRVFRTLEDPLVGTALLG